MEIQHRCKSLITKVSEDVLGPSWEIYSATGAKDHAKDGDQNRNRRDFCLHQVSCLSATCTDTLGLPSYTFPDGVF